MQQNLKRPVIAIAVVAVFLGAVALLRGGSHEPPSAGTPGGQTGGGNVESGGSELERALSLIPGTEQKGLPTQRISVQRADGRSVDFTVEVASTEDERERGLMHRKSLPENEGMLFLFPKAEPLTFWMKNTDIPLDIIFIRQGGQISNIVTGQPDDESVIKSLDQAKAVLEIGGGLAAKYMIKPRDQVLYVDSPSEPDNTSTAPAQTPETAVTPPPAAPSAAAGESSAPQPTATPATAPKPAASAPVKAAPAKTAVVKHAKKPAPPPVDKGDNDDDDTESR